MKSGTLLVHSTVCAIISLALNAQQPRTLRGVVHDPQQHPVEGAQITVNCQAAVWHARARSNAEGEFDIDAPPGVCEVLVYAPSFRAQAQNVNQGARSSVLHFQLELNQVRQSVQVSASRLDSQVQLYAAKHQNARSSRLPELAKQITWR